MEASRSDSGKPLSNPANLNPSGQDLSVRVEIPQSHPKNKELLKRTQPHGQRIALGVAQIMVGLVFIAFGVPLKLSPQSFAAGIGTPWWGGALFIIAGLILIIAERKLKRYILRMSVFANLLSASVALGVSLLFSIDLRKWVPYLVSKNETSSSSEYGDLAESQFCLRVILLIFALMELAISGAVATIGWKEMWKRSETSKNELMADPSNSEQTYEVFREPTYTTMSALKNWKSQRLHKNAK
ncbi:high affinity immunoglobulin epsilon receptor subunit beta-like [Scyliorhinus canicula]|uniref:high affinity immunoglobulin epsilon receptor subunit beta-like n=1 Tax=Scyliorhinus canicula TaxID=7830 RepID=UPI0018F491CA|nr:high affinity immunoglobulin epsilon receptor subunit beta-like [Scyliorhinus canicula]